jgi:F-type H+-transporting ATPase subunit b
MEPGKMPAPKAEAHQEHCPGHGPDDPPHHINWYQGLLGVNNAKAKSPSFIDRLLWRYENPKDECDANNQPPPFLGSFINFAIVAFVLFRFGKGPIVEGLAKRKKTIMGDIDAATELRRSAEKRLKDYEKQLAKIETRRTELREESRTAWESEKARLLAEAEERGARLRRDAELRVGQELKQAEADLINEAVDSAVAAAEELLKKRIQATDQDRLADEFAKSLGESLRAGQARMSAGASERRPS